MDLPTVSIIIPIYNAELFLRETMASVLSQAYPKIEVVLIDDASTDGSYNLALEYEAPTVIVRKNRRKGACAARNYGLELSTGDYIQYLDADDLLSPNKIKKQIALLQFNMDFIASCKWGRFYGSKDTVQWEKQLINKDYETPSQWLADSWLGGGMAQTAVWLTPRKLIEMAGPWNEELQLNQDGEFFSRVLLTSKGITFVRGCGVYYRSGLANSISKKRHYRRDKAESLLKSYQSYKEHIESYGILQNLKTALGNNFLMFIYEYHTHFPDLSRIAENEFYELGHQKMWPVGGARFQKITKLIGLRNALLLKKIIGS